jgi:hypothetical protein
MERIVPRTVSEEIELYERTIYSLLKSTTDVQLRTLEEVHASTHSLLHPNARDKTIDVSALLYAWLRLPPIMPEVNRVILGQNEATFIGAGYENVSDWQIVKAPARRRHYRYETNTGNMSAFIASRSDIDDMIPSLVALQIEWNKIHNALSQTEPNLINPPMIKEKKHLQKLADAIEMRPKDIQRLKKVWGENFYTILRDVANRRMDLRIQLLNGSLVQYWRATRIWWDEVEENAPDVTQRPIYFVSSNTHVFVNLITGYAQNKQDEILALLNEEGQCELLEEWEQIKEYPAKIPNFLYYAFKKIQQSQNHAEFLEEFEKSKAVVGINEIPSQQTFDVEAQIFDLSKIDPALLDKRAIVDGMELLKQSSALIVNIDYPLGIAAYNILRMIAENTEEIRGIYILGKAATLNGVRGDVMIPNVIQDEHSENTYMFNNAFNASDIAPYLQYGTVLDNQKAVSVLGTFMQNSRIMDVIYREGYTDIEMEGGPYLSAVCEMVRPKRHPKNEIVNLYQIPFDLGILHYASDTPLSKGKNLGAGTLSFAGMDPTYGSGVAILRRIFTNEINRLSK